MTAKASPTSHSYFSQRMKLHYLDWGNEQAPPLLMIHGSRDHCHNWDWLAQALRDEYHIIAPDLRGHGDSQWAIGGNYSFGEYVYDIAQLVHQTRFAPMTVIAHSLGGGVALRYAGIYPENISKMVVIEGTGGGWRSQAPIHSRIRDWIENTRKMSGRLPRRYPSLEDAYHRMQTANSHLRPDQAQHLTVHGANQNEDGAYTWKFDNYTHSMSPFDFSQQETQEIYQRIDSPVLLVSGSESWHGKATNLDEVTRQFPHARHHVIEDAGHWVHHDQLDEFIRITREFLAP